MQITIRDAAKQIKIGSSLKGISKLREALIVFESETLVPATLKRLQSGEKVLLHPFEFQQSRVTCKGGLADVPLATEPELKAGELHCCLNGKRVRIALKKVWNPLTCLRIFNARSVCIKLQMKICPFQHADEPAVIALWEICGLVVPQNDPVADIARKLRVNPEWFLVGEVDGAVVATCMAGYEGHRGWINYLAVHPRHQRQSLARQLMSHAEALLQAAGCPKINLQVRRSNAAVIAFYEALGFGVDDVVSLGKRLHHDSPMP